MLVFLGGATVDQAMEAYDATGQSAWRARLRTRLLSLCAESLGGCAPPVDPSRESGDPPEGYPADLPEDEDQQN